MTEPRWTPDGRRRTWRVGAAGVALLTVGLAACGSELELTESPVDDTSETGSSDDVSETADTADQTGSPDADDTDLASVVFDDDPLPVEAVTCDHGPEFTAQLADGGDLRVATEEDGTLTVQIVVPRDGASHAWATDEAEATQLEFLADRVEGEATLTPVDQAGEADASRDDAEVRFDLACDA